jgi:hypothetical protein
VFVSNARGVAAVSRVDVLSVPVCDDRMQTLADAYASVAWDPI